MEYKTHNFVREDVLKQCNEFCTNEKQLDYLRWVEKEKKINPTDLDYNIRRTPSFEKWIRIEIEYREMNGKTDLEKNNEQRKQNQKIEQDLIIEKFGNYFRQYDLVKGKSIPNEILHEISMKILSATPKELENFKTGDSTYQVARQYASVLGYKRKRRGLLNDLN
jgi:hypothetical protein